MWYVQKWADHVAGAGVVLVALILLHCSTAALAEVRQATAAEQDTIQKLIDRAKRATDGSADPDLARAKADKDELERNMGFDHDNFDRPYKPGHQPGPISATDLRRLSDGDRERYFSASDFYNEHQQKAAELYNQTIAEAIKSYHIEPLQGTGTSQTGNAVEWKPVFSDKPRAGQDAPVDFKDEPAFSSYYTGAITLRSTAFSYPGMLGLVIYHETLHFNDALIPALDLRNSPENEVRVRLSTLPKLESVFGLSSHDWKAEVLNIEGQAVLAEKWAEKLRYIPDPNDRPGEFPNNLTPIELRRVRESVERAINRLNEINRNPSGSVDDKLQLFRTTTDVKFIRRLDSATLRSFMHDVTVVAEKHEVELRLRQGSLKGLSLLVGLQQLPSGLRVEAKRAAQELKSRQLVEERQRFQEEVREFNERQKAWHLAYLAKLEREKPLRDSAWGYLRALTGIACSDPDIFAQQVSAHATINVALTENQLFDYRTHDPTLNPCQDDVLEVIELAGTPISAVDLLAWVRRYRSEHPTLLARLAGSIDDFFGALGKFLDALAAAMPEPASGGSPVGSGSSASSGERSGRSGSSESHVHYRSGPAIGQATGVLSHGW